MDVFVTAAVRTGMKKQQLTINSLRSQFKLYKNKLQESKNYKLGTRMTRSSFLELNLFTLITEI